MPTTATAAPADEAEALLRDGSQLRRQRRHEEALKLFLKAHRLRPSPKSEAQIGVTYQALGNWPLAEVHIKKALESDADPFVAKNAARLREALQVVGRHLGSLHLSGGKPGARVYVNHRLVGELPLQAALRLPTGLSLIEVKLEGHLPFTRQVEIVGGQSFREKIDLIAIRGTGAPSSSGAVIQKNGASADRGEERRRAAWIAGWVSVGAGVALLATGGAGVAIREQAIASFRDTCSPGGPLPPSCLTDFDRGQLGERLAIGGFVAGGALAATGAVLLIWARPKRSMTAGTNRLGGVQLGRGPGQLGLSLKGSF